MAKFQAFSVTVFFVLCILAASCSPVGPQQVNVVKESLFCNVREYTSGNVRFLSRPIENGDNYRILRVGTPGRPYADHPALKLKLPDGTVIDTSAPDVDRLKALASSDEAARQPVYDRDAKKYEQWPDNARRLTIGPWTFILDERRLMSFDVYYRQDSQWRWPGYVPAIGLSGEDAMYELPLKQADVLRVFGKPQAIKEYLEE